MAVVVTGANGFIGSFLVESLLKRRYEVRCFVLAGEPLRSLKGLPVKLYTGDICRIETMYEALEGVDYVYHLAGVKTAWDRATYFRVNLEGTKNILQATCRKAGHLKRFLYLSSQMAAGPSSDGRPLTEDQACQPISSYGKSKQAAEAYLQARWQQVPITIIRPSLVYGPRDPELEALFKIMKWGIMPTIGHRDQYLNLIYVRDLVEGIILAAEHEKANGQIYFMSGQESYSWQDIAERFFQVRKKRGRVVSIPWGGIQAVARVIQWYGQVRGRPVSLIDEKLKEAQQSHWLCSSQKANQDLGFAPKVSLPEGFEEIIRWVEKTE